MEAKGGRPLIYTPERIEEIKIMLEDYIEDEEVIVPIVAEFAYKNKIRRQSLYEHEEFSDTLKRLKDKKEAQLEYLGLFNVVNTTMAIFSLKQLGWSDKMQMTSDITINSEFDFVDVDEDTPEA